MTIHILNQYFWPDCAPTSLYAEQLGLCLQRNGRKVVVVSGSGSYRVFPRDQPALEHRRLVTRGGQRRQMSSTLREYLSVGAAFKRYIQAHVQEGDVVICTSAPPQSIHLIHVIRKKKATAIYWLQDYYPELLRGAFKYPLFVRSILSNHWNRKLSCWDHVVKIASNLAYEGRNARVLRNWPTLDLGQPRPFEPKTAYYFGNLGYGHSLPAFLQTCTRLRDEGCSVTIVGDGPKISLLPSWITIVPPPDEPTLIGMYWRAEIHLIAADPEMTGALFPSKYWNSRQTGRKIIASGFTGSMLEELETANGLATLPSAEDWLPLLGS